jgi:chromosome segregation ATPase
VSAILIDTLMEAKRDLGIEVEALKSCLRTVRHERDEARQLAARRAERIAELETHLDQARAQVVKLQDKKEAANG